jgi:hypothetical protein
MLLRNSVLALAALAALASTMLTPTSASAAGYHSGHHIIVVCRKAGGVK